MSILQQAPSPQGTGHTHPYANDPQYWGDRYRRELCRRQYVPVIRPNPELEENARYYWSQLFPQEQPNGSR